MAVVKNEQRFIGEWSVWVDRGGTFTDVVARHTSGELRVHKLLSENPSAYQDAAVQGIRDILNLATSESLGEQNIRCVKMGTTVATNALLERKGEKTALLITKGFSDLLEIAYQTRPDIFALHIKKHLPLYAEAFEIDERISANGHIISALNIETTQATLEAVFNAGFHSVAIVLLHSYINPCHEEQLASMAKAQGFSQVSVSSQINPFDKSCGSRGYDGC